jgi:hypothetical protein
VILPGRWARFGKVRLAETLNCQMGCMVKTGKARRRCGECVIVRTDTLFDNF